MDGKGMEKLSGAVGDSTEHGLRQYSTGPLLSSPVCGSELSPPSEPLDKQRQLEAEVVDLLTHHELARTDETVDGVLVYCAKYTFQKNPQKLRSLAWNDYGQGKLDGMGVARTGHALSPLPVWLENGVGLEVFFKERVATQENDFTRGYSKPGFEIPWEARIQLSRVPDQCSLTDVQLGFAHVDHLENPTATVEIWETHATNLSHINSKLASIDSQTFSECGQDLGIFREAYCIVTMRVPLRRLLGDKLHAFRQTFPDRLACSYDLGHTGTDTVTLKTRDGKIESHREILVDLSPKTRAIFGERPLGKVIFYELDCRLDAALAVLDAAVAKHESLPIDPHRASPFFLYEAMKLALSWEIPQLTLWTQVAFLERLCRPDDGILEAVPVLDAVRVIRDHADAQAVGGRMILCGLVMVLRNLHSPALGWELDELKNIIARKPALWKNVIYPTRLENDCDLTVEINPGRKIYFSVNLAYWVRQLKVQIQEIEELPMDQQRLVFDGQIMEDERTLADCGIGHRDSVQLLRDCN
ncbi:uncharacterized protein LOC129593784 [Paramacrobiotus metropolitanus]|uniref:uncharacterized protein LOC129593784 n=1 Tax=Paramacrobiotus metropolitanus TaxID=2943436 RepID=UPI00244647A8|nr:uncharacterized protein LOC129593784 [Paramacrobiotus metropolitanus]